MRVKLDENLPTQLKHLFTESGCDAATVLDEGLGGASDAALASACAEEQRVLLTQDLDFSDVRSYPPAEYSGIVVFRLASGARDSILDVGAFLIERMWESSPAGQLWIVEDLRIRIRV
jgi:hypothetical protein